MMIEYLDQLDSFVWGPPLLILLVGTGIMLTIRLGGIQLLKLPHALKLIFKKEQSGEGDISSFGALCTALAATVGTGKHYWRGDCDCSGRTRCFILDVVSRFLWNGN